MQRAMFSHWVKPLARYLDWRILLGAAALVSAFCYIYATALSLPVSLIDDLVHLDDTEHFWLHLHQQGLLAALRADISLTLGVMNPLYEIGTGLIYRLNGGNPFHGIKLLTLALVALSIMLAPVFQARYRELPWRPSTLLAGMMAALMFVVAEPPTPPSFQSLRGNWIRLHTTDSAMTFFVALYVPALLASLSTVGKKRLLAAIGTGVLLTLSISMKPTAAVLIGPLAVLAGIFAVCRDRQRAWVCALIALWATLYALGSIAFFKTLMPDASQPRYTNTYSLTPQRVVSGLLFFTDQYWQMLGPMAIWLPAAWLVRVIFQRHDWRRQLHREAPPVFLALCWLALVFVYTPWSHRLARYLVSNFMVFSCLVALETANQFEWLAAYPKRLRLLPWGFGGVVSVLLHPVTWLIPVFCVVLWLSRGSQKQWRCAAWLGGIGMTGAVYLVFVLGLMSVPGAHVLHVERERLQYKVSLEVAERFRQKQVVGFVGNVRDEHLISICALAQRRGIAPRMKSVQSKKDLEGVSTLLISEALTPSPNALSGQKVHLENMLTLSRKELSLPVGFWRWHDQAWHKHQFKPLYTVATADAWAFCTAP